MRYKPHRITAYLFICVLMGMGTLQAQTVPDAEFGSIPDSLHVLNAPEKNPDAGYMITNKELDVRFRESGGSIVAVLEHHVRLKLFDEEAAGQAATVAIPYYFANEMESISNIQGLTHLPSGRREELREEDIKTINLNARYNVMEFILPAAEKGAVLEYRYVIQRRYIEELPDFYLSHRVPTAAASVSITYPGYLRYQAVTENFDDELQRDVVYTDTSSVPRIFTIPRPDPIVTEQWAARDIPPVEEQPYLSSLNDHRGKIKFLLDEFGIPRQHLETSWDFIVAKMRRDLNPWHRVRKNQRAGEIGDSLARAHKDQPAKAIQDSIYRYLSERVNYSGSNAPYSEVADTMALSGEPADQAAINQTLLAMLQGGGIKAAPLLVSTRQAGSINRDFPSFYQFNGQLIQSEIEGQIYVMDASYPHSQPGLIPVDVYNSPGLRFGEESYDWAEVEPDISRYAIGVEIEANLMRNGDMAGTARIRQSGYPAQLIRQQKADGQSNEQIVMRSLFDGYGGMETGRVEVSNLNNYEKPVEITAEFEIANYATSFSDGLNYRPMIVGYMMENPFEDDQRSLPVTLDAPEELNLSYTISLPDGFSVGEGRQNQALTLPGASFEEHYDIRSNEMNYEYQIDIRNKEFSTDVFPQLYDLYHRWVELSNTTWLIKRN